jgi:hypothetical protein
LERLKKGKSDALPFYRGASLASGAHFQPKPLAVCKIISKFAARKQDLST